MLTRVWAASVVMIAGLIGPTISASAAPVVCPQAWVWNGAYQACTLTSSHGGGGGGGMLMCGSLPQPPDSTPVCLDEMGQHIPCETHDGYSIGAPNFCYVKRSDPQPPKGEDPWPRGETKGAIYDCSKRYLAGNNDLDYQFWSATPPAPSGADPLVLVGEAVSRMGLRGITMGSPGTR